MYYLKCSVNIFITHVTLTAVDPWEKFQQSHEFYYYFFKRVTISCGAKK
jgi:hypothetical protein